MSNKARRKRDVSKSVHFTEDPEDKNPPILAELGVTGLRQFSGFVRDEWHKDLQGKKGIKVYREMADNHSMIGGAFFIIEMIIRQLKYRVDASGESVDHQRAELLIETAFDDIKGGVNKIMSDALTMLPFGWSWLEKVFKISRGEHESKYFKSNYDDGMIRWRKFGIRAQESLFKWEFDEGGEVLAMIQRAPNDSKERRMPRSKALHIRLLSSKDNPEGRQLLRHVYTDYYCQKQMKFTEAVGIYRSIAGFPHIQVPLDYTKASASAEKKAAYASYLDMGKKIAVDEYTCIVMPSELDKEGKPTGFKFELISASGKNMAATDPIIKRYDSSIAIGLSSQLIKLGQDGAGSLALSDNQTKVLGFAVAAIVDSVLDEINDDAIPELCALNGIDRQYAPTLERSDIESADLGKLGGFFASMGGAGFITPDDALEDHLREVVSAPPREVQEQPAGAPVEPEEDPELSDEVTALLGRAQ